MYALWLSFLFGFVMFPVLYAFIPTFIGLTCKKKKVPDMIKPLAPISDKLKLEIEKSLVLNEDLGWINIIIQRMFFDSIRNYYLEHRIRDSIIKSFSFSIGEGLLKKIRIKSLNFGAEAPYLKQIKLITVEEYNNIIINEEKSDLQKEFFIEMNYSKASSSDTLKNKDDLKSKEACANQNESINESLEAHNHFKDTLKDEAKSNNDYNMLDSENTGYNDEDQLNEHAKLEDIEINKSKSPKNGDEDPSIIIENYCNLNYKLPFQKFCSPEGLKEKLKDCEFNQIFRHATFFGYFEYSGDIQMMIEVELPKGVSISLMVTLRKIFSNFLLRVPAINNNTRYEISLINNPLIDIEIDSGVVTHLKKLYFQGSISRFIKKIALNSFKNTIVYPAWLQLIQPNTSSTRFQNFTPIYITSKNIQDAFDSLDQILVIISSDFKLIDAKNEIIYKKSHSALNDKNFIFAWSFKLGSKIGQFSEYKAFESISSNESRAFTILQTTEYLKKLFPALKSMATVFEMKNVSILKMIFNSHEQEYVKIIYKNNFVLYKNNPRSGEFIVFKVQDENFLIFNYSVQTTDIFFNNKRVEKLKKLFDEGHFILNKVESKDLSYSSEDNENKTLNFETMFKEALRVDNIDFSRFTCFLKMPKKVLKNILKNPAVRLKLFEENGKLVGTFEESQNISTLISEYSMPITNEIKELRIHSLQNPNFIVDICPERNQTFIYKVHSYKGTSCPKTNKKDSKNLYKSGNVPKENLIDEMQSKETSNICEKNKLENFQHNESSKELIESHKASSATCILEILYKSEISVFFPNFFIEYIKIKESFQPYFTECDKMAYIQAPNELKYETYVFSGTIYFEFKCELEDDYSLEIFSCKKQMIIFEIYKIITIKEFKCIYPVDNDYIRITLYPKHKKNSFIEYKFRNFNFQKNILVEGFIGLNVNEKLKIKIDGAPSHVIFWEKSSIIPTSAYIQDAYDKTIVNDSGILRADSKEYIFAIKNRLEKQRNISIYTGFTELK